MLQVDECFLYRYTPSFHLEQQRTPCSTLRSLPTANQVDDVYEFTIVRENTAYIRFAFETPADASSVIITVNEEINEGTTAIHMWESTGHAFVPADYESRILELEDKVEEVVDKVEDVIEGKTE